MNDHLYREWSEDLHAQLTKGGRWKDSSAVLGLENDPSIVWRVPHPLEGSNPHTALAGSLLGPVSIIT